MGDELLLGTWGHPRDLEGVRDLVVREVSKLRWSDERAKEVRFTAGITLLYRDPNNVASKYQAAVMAHDPNEEVLPRAVIKGECRTTPVLAYLTLLCHVARLVDSGQVFSWQQTGELTSGIVETMATIFE